MPHRAVSILLVEDDEDDYLLTVDLIEEIGETAHEITWACSFEDGIEKLMATEFDVCLVDFRIGGRTGLDFVQETKWMGLTVPIVFLTGMGDRQTDIAAMQAGAYDFLQKSDLTSAMLDRAIRYSISLAESRRVLLEQTVLLQATLDNTGAAIAAVDQAGKMVTWNDRFVELALKISSSLARDGSEAAKLPDLSNVRLNEWLPFFGQSWDEFDSGDGQILSIRRNNTADGGAVIVCNDITQHKRAEQALRDAMLQAESASASKSAFLANVSHELRTPLNAIIGFAELMKSRSHGPVGCAEYEDYVNFIKESGDSLLRIINATLDLSRIEANEYPLDLHDVFVEEVIGASVRQISALAQTKDIEFDVTVEHDGLCLTVDENALAKVLAQLLSNAIKFSHRKGIVKIAARAVGAATEISVTDHGIGMDASEVERAMSSFSQVDDQLTRNYDGVGLGLPLARALVELHGGSLMIQSKPKEGTAILVLLPGPAAATDTNPEDADHVVGALTA